MRRDRIKTRRPKWRNLTSRSGWKRSKRKHKSGVVRDPLRRQQKTDRKRAKDKAVEPTEEDG